MADILLDEGTLKIENGDFCAGDSQAQNEALILMAQKGSFREQPNLGVGMIDYLNAEDLGGLSTSIKREMKKDGIQVSKVSMENGKLILEKK